MQLLQINSQHPPRPLQCSSMKELRQYHSQFIRLGFSSDNHAMAPLLKFCALSPNGDFFYAIRLFDHIPHPDAFLYNTLIKATSLRQRTSSSTSILLYSRMLHHFVPPNHFTFPPLIRACCHVQLGRQVHAHVLKFGFGPHSVSLNNLIHMYLGFQALEEARRLFDHAPHKDFISWTTLISGYAQWGLVDEAFRIFQLMPYRNSASWNAMIAAYVQSNRFPEAFALFDRMRAEKVALDEFVAATMLSACTGLGALEQGEWIHAYIQKNRIQIDSKLATTLIDMYCKCGSWEKGLTLFNNLPSKGLYSWNCIIGGLAMHGKGKVAIEIFKEMEREMVAPDKVTFLNLLSACAHSGLVEEGRFYFSYMVQVHGIEPTTQHYGCLIDLLGRAGMLKEAREIINEMPINPDATVLGALFGACKKHRNMELGEEIGRRVIEMEPNNSGRYVLLASLYADVGRWEEAGKVRKLMNDRGVKKAPGFSMIEIGGDVNEFTAGGRGHPEDKQIYAKVEEMVEAIKRGGSSRKKEEEEEEEEEVGMKHHSEKLAIAYGLLRSKAGDTLRITKNLRICKDCHEASKAISKLYDREIIVRDRNRFHHFSKGECSCKDYW